MFCSLSLQSVRPVVCLCRCEGLLRVSHARSLRQRCAECCRSSFRGGASWSFRCCHTRSTSFSQLIVEHALLRRLRQQASSQRECPRGVTTTGQMPSVSTRKSVRVLSLLPCAPAEKHENAKHVFWRAGSSCVCAAMADGRAPADCRLELVPKFRDGPRDGFGAPSHMRFPVFMDNDDPSSFTKHMCRRMHTVVYVARLQQ